MEKAHQSTAFMNTIGIGHAATAGLKPSPSSPNSGQLVLQKCISEKKIKSSFRLDGHSIDKEIKKVEMLNLSKVRVSRETLELFDEEAR